MENPGPFQPTLTRRDMLKGAAVVLGATLVGCEEDGKGPAGAGSLMGASASTARRRIAIVGGGAGGIAAAYFLSPHHDVQLFESRSKVGGHCDSQAVDYKGVRINVDLGAQFFHPDTHPIYVTLLEELGLYNPENPNADETLEAPGSICFLNRGALLPAFSSKHPYLTPFFAVDFAIYSQYARAAVLNNLSWETTLEEWIGKLPVSGRFKDSLLYPWISAAIGTTRDNARRSSARSILQTFALAFPSNIFKGASTFNSALGLEGNLRRLLDRSAGTRVHLDAAVTGLDFAAGTWAVRTASAAHGPFDAVVVNAPPRVSRILLQPLPWAGGIVSLLGRYEYFDARMVIHTDAKYVHRDRAFWAAYNGMIEGVECEGSVWYDGIHQKLPGGGTVDIFKSWAQRRHADPAEILHERRFKHPLVTPDGIRAARALRAHQGRNGLWLSGQHTTGMDLQESAVFSAMKVAESLAPASPSLRALRDRLNRRGRGQVNYDL